MDLGAHLLELAGVAGVTGSEQTLARLLQQRWAPYVDEARVDRLGNYLGVRRGRGERPPRVLVAAHLDTIGLLVTAVVAGGFLRVTRVGGVDRRCLPGLEVLVHGRNGPLPGVVGVQPPHLKSREAADRAPRPEELWIDLGLPEAAVREQVAPGDRVTFRHQVGALLNDRYAGAYLDNRAGVAAVAAALQELQQMERQGAERHRAELWFAGTVGEEFNMAGAGAAAYQLEPDVAIAVDVTFGASPGASEDHFPLDGGPTIMFGPNCHPGLARYMRRVAEVQGIPCAAEVTGASSGTDAWAMQVVGRGCMTGVVSIPLRYMHNPAELVSLADIRQAGRLLAHVLAGLDEGQVRAWTSHS